MKSKSKFNLLSVLLVALVFLASCSVDTEIAPASNDADLTQDVAISAKAQQQIDDIFTFWGKNFPNSDLQPIGIEQPKLIRSDVDKEAILSRISSSDSRFASYDGVNPSSMQVFTLDSKKNSRQLSRAARETVSSLLEDGQGYVNFRWKYKGEEFTTPFIYNNEGFVYEPMAASIAIKSSDVKANARTNYIQYFDLLWIWGGKRGHVRISHTINCSGSRLTNHSGWSDAYMSLGSAQAQIITNGSNYSKSCTSWGYAWATSPLTVTVSTNWGASGTYQGISWSGSVGASVSGGLGSSGKATGFDVMACP
jgi:hypothetical protein